MSENNHRPLLVEFRQVIIQPLQCGWLDFRAGAALAFGRVQSEELPAPVLERIVETIRKNVFVGFAVRLRHIIVIANHPIRRETERFKDVIDRTNLLSFAVIREVTDNQRQVNSWRTAFHLRDDFLKILGASLVVVMEIIDDNKTEFARVTLAFGAKSARPKTQG